MSNIELRSYNSNIVKESHHFPQCQCYKKKLTTCCFIFSNEPESCSKSKKWLKRVKLPHRPTTLYEKLLKLTSSSPEISQIELDISRTFSEKNYFSNSIGKRILSRLLHAYCTYAPAVGYVQGMNYIAATLLWHCNEVDAFWLFVVLNEDFELRNNFIPGFPGLTKHYHALEYLINQLMPNLYIHLLNCNIFIPMFTTEWFMTLFTSHIPLEHSFRVLTGFFKNGWVFLYKVCLSIISRLSEKILEGTNFALILSTLKPNNHSEKESIAFMKSMEKTREKISWKIIIKEASQLEIDEGFLNLWLNNLSSKLLIIPE